jgi:hypothetical protein
MGMFDELTCEYPLPDGEVQEDLFQTKSLDCTLDHYTITKDGRLILHKVRYESVPEEERPYDGTSEWKEPTASQLMGSLRSVPVGDVVIPYHGYIRFYTYVGKHPAGELFEYLAKFTDGRLVEMRRVQEDDVAEMPEAGSRWGADQVRSYLQNAAETEGGKTIVQIEETMAIEVFFDPAGREDGYTEDICFSILETGPPDLSIFAAEATSILLTAAQAEQLAVALLKAAQASRETE